MAERPSCHAGDTPLSRCETGIGGSHDGSHGRPLELSPEPVARLAMPAVMIREAVVPYPNRWDAAVPVPFVDHCSLFTAPSGAPWPAVASSVRAPSPRAALQFLLPYAI